MKLPGTWKNRRRVIFSTLIFCALIVSYITVWGVDTILHRSIAEALILLAGGVIGSYVFGAVVDDHWVKKDVDDGSK